MLLHILINFEGERLVFSTKHLDPNVQHKGVFQGEQVTVSYGQWDAWGPPVMHRYCSLGHGSQAEHNKHLLSKTLYHLHPSKDE